MNDFISQEEMHILKPIGEKTVKIKTSYSVELLKDQLKSCQQKKNNAIKLIKEDYDPKIEDLKNAISILENKLI